MLETDFLNMGLMEQQKVKSVLLILLWIKSITKIISAQDEINWQTKYTQYFIH